jgi:Ca-activated chloride channel homolog
MKRQITLVISIIMIASLTACGAATVAPVTSAAATEAPAIAEAPRSQEPAATYAPQSVGPEDYLVPTIVVNAPNNGMDNYFQDYGVNPFVRAESDNLSTFALDVDTASYQLTREYVADGALPPMDAVRTEEFINAFDQGYSSLQEAAFTLYADGGPSPFINPDNLLIRIGVQGYRVPDSERKPFNLTFVVDVSGSMAEESRLEMVKDSLHLLVGQLDDRDTVTIVAYSETAWLVLEPTNASETRAIDRAINSMYPTNTTNAEAGLRLGYKYAYRMLDPEAVNRVVLCSDGVANVGNTGSGSIMETISGYVDAGITLTAIGVGMGNYNDVLLEQLADSGDGNYYYVNTMDEAHQVFVEDLIGTMQVIAYDAKIQIDFNSDVVYKYRLIGYENRNVADEDFRDDTVDAGEIGAGMTAVALYEVELVEGAEGRIATAQLRWQDADSREVIEIDGNIYTADMAPSFEDTSPYFQLTATVAGYAEILRDSPYVEGTLNDVAQEARRVARLMGENSEANEFADLTGESVSLSRRD